jgi:hypothetical protein
VGIKRQENGLCTPPFQGQDRERPTAERLFKINVLHASDAALVCNWCRDCNTNALHRSIPQSVPSGLLTTVRFPASSSPSPVGIVVWISFWLTGARTLRQETVEWGVTISRNSNLTVPIANRLSADRSRRGYLMRLRAIVGDIQWSVLCH